MKRLFAWVLSILIICTVLNACTNADKEHETASTTQATGETSSGIDVDEAYNYLLEFYGKGFTINPTVLKDNVQEYDIKDKKGNLYSKVKINLDTAQMTEEIIGEEEVNEYTIK